MKKKRATISIPEYKIFYVEDSEIFPWMQMWMANGDDKAHILLVMAGSQEEAQKIGEEVIRESCETNATVYLNERISSVLSKWIMLRKLDNMLGSN